MGREPSPGESIGEPPAVNLQPDSVVGATRGWVERVVIGLNLCPFARSVQSQGLVRYAVSSAGDTDALCDDLRRELLLLTEIEPTQVDTTLLIHPFVLGDFFDYNDFLARAEELLEELDLIGELQLASFHPRYQFAGSSSEDPANYTNRSPYPMLHLLREASISRALTGFPDPASIYEKNMHTLRTLGAAALADLSKAR